MAFLSVFHGLFTSCKDIRHSLIWPLFTWLDFSPVSSFRKNSGDGLMEALAISRLRFSSRGFSHHLI